MNLSAELQTLESIYEKIANQASTPRNWWVIILLIAFSMAIEMIR